MKLRLGLIVILIGGAAVESFGLPWVSLVGLSLPMTLVGLAVASVTLPRSWLLWIALIMGLVLDLSSLAPIGMWTLYCLLWVVIFDKLNQPAGVKLKRPWWQLALAAVAAVALAPLYGAVLSQEQVALDQSLGLEMITRLIIVLPPVVIILGLLSRRSST